MRHTYHWPALRIQVSRWWALVSTRRSFPPLIWRRTQCWSSSTAAASPWRSATRDDIGRLAKGELRWYGSPCRHLAIVVESPPETDENGYNLQHSHRFNSNLFLPAPGGARPSLPLHSRRRRVGRCRRN